MAQQLSPWLEGAYGWNFGEGGWNTGMDQNLLKFSFMFDRNVDSIVASLPAAVNGQAHYLTTDNRLYFAVGTTYFSTIVPKWFTIVNRSTGQTHQFNGASLVQIDSPSQIDTRLDAVELTVASLGTAAFEDVEFFATQSELDIAEADAAAYTDVLRNDLATDNDSLKGAGQVGHMGRFVLDRLIDLAYVTDHGAAVDGVTDDRVALMAAIATGKNVVIPGGSFTATLLAGDVPNFLAACDKLHWFCDSWVVNLPAGDFSEAQRTEIKMTNANRGQIRGASPIPLTFSSLGAQSSVGSGNHSVTVNFVDASTVAIGDFVICRALTGTRQAVLRGMHEVTNVVGNAVTFKVTARIATLPTLNVTGGTFFKMPTVLRYTGNHTGIYVRCRFGDSSQYLDGLRDLAIVGPGTGAASVGIFVEGGCSLNLRYEVGVANFGSHGIEGIYGSVVRGQNTVASGNGENGYYALAGVTFEAVGSSSTGNGGYGYVSTQVANLSFGGYCSAGNANGVFVDSVSSGIGDDGFIEDNTALGAFVTGSSKLRIRSANVTGNQTGLRVDEGSVIDFNSGTSSGNSLNAFIIEDFGSRILGGSFTGTQRYNGTPNRILTASQALNFGTVTADTSSTLTIPLVGVTAAGWVISGTPNVHTDGIIFTYETGVDLVTVRASNVRTSNIAVSNRTFAIVATEI